LHPVKERVTKMLADAIGRRDLDHFHWRHILICGGFGAGKQTAAQVRGLKCSTSGEWAPSVVLVVSGLLVQQFIQIHTFTDFFYSPTWNPTTSYSRS
jgi:hypothetical protein